MKAQIFSFRQIVSVIFLFFFSHAGYAQKKTSSDIDQENSLNFNSIIFSFDYSSNTGLLGQYNTEIKQPSFTPSLSFYSKYGFDVGAMLPVINNSDETFSKATTELNLLLGYQWKIGKYFSVYPNYSHYFQSNNSNSIKSDFTDNFQLDVSLDYKFYSTSLSGSYLIGEDREPFVTYQNYFLIEKENFISRKMYVAIQPGFYFVWSNTLSFEDILQKTILRDSSSINTFYENHERIRKFRLRNPEVTDEYIITRIASYFFPEEKEFKLTSFNIVLPVYLMFNNLAVNFSLLYNQPFNVPAYFDDSAQFYISTGLSYSFIW